MNKLLSALVIGLLAAGSAVAADTATKSTDAMKSGDAAKSDAVKYKDCMKKDASGKDTMDQACKDKVDKGSMAKSTDSMKAPDKGAVPTGSDGKAAPKGK